MPLGVIKFVLCIFTCSKIYVFLTARLALKFLSGFNKRTIWLLCTRKAFPWLFIFYAFQGYRLLQIEHGRLGGLLWNSQAFAWIRRLLVLGRWRFRFVDIRVNRFENVLFCRLILFSFHTLVDGKLFFLLMLLYIENGHFLIPRRQMIIDTIQILIWSEIFI